MLSLLLFSFRKSQPRPGGSSYLYLYTYTYFVAGISSHLHPVTPSSLICTKLIHPLTERRNIKREGRGLAIFVCVKKEQSYLKTFFPANSASPYPPYPLCPSPACPLCKNHRVLRIYFSFSRNNFQNKHRRAENWQKIYTKKSSVL